MNSWYWTAVLNSWDWTAGIEHLRLNGWDWMEQQSWTSEIEKLRLNSWDWTAKIEQLGWKSWIEQLQLNSCDWTAGLNSWNYTTVFLYFQQICCSLDTVKTSVNLIHKRKRKNCKQKMKQNEKIDDKKLSKKKQQYWSETIREEAKNNLFSFTKRSEKEAKRFLFRFVLLQSEKV